MNGKAFLGFLGLLLGIVLLLGCAVNDTGDGSVDGITGDAAAGQTLYDNNCASCHRAGAHDTAGNAPDLTGRISRISVSFVLQHRGLSWSQTDVDNLKAFLDAQ